MLRYILYGTSIAVLVGVVCFLLGFPRWVVCFCVPPIVGAVVAVLYTPSKEEKNKE